MTPSAMWRPRSTPTMLTGGLQERTPTPTRTQSTPRTRSTGVTLRRIRIDQRDRPDMAVTLTPYLLKGQVSHQHLFLPLPSPSTPFNLNPIWHFLWAHHNFQFLHGRFCLHCAPTPYKIQFLLVCLSYTYIYGQMTETCKHNCWLIHCILAHIAGLQRIFGWKFYISFTQKSEQRLYIIVLILSESTQGKLNME